MLSEALVDANITHAVLKQENQARIEWGEQARVELVRSQPAIFTGPVGAKTAGRPQSPAAVFSRCDAACHSPVLDAAGTWH